eukprot:157884-Pleurochrysis_carterae.AAC.1
MRISLPSPSRRLPTTADTFAAMHKARRLQVGGIRVLLKDFRSYSATMGDFRQRGGIDCDGLLAL